MAFHGFVGTLSRIFSLGKAGERATLDATSLTAERTYTFPDKSGTVALTSDIPSGEQITTDRTINIPEDYATANAALDYLDTVGIAKNVYVTVQINNPTNQYITLSNYNLPTVSIRVGDGGSGIGDVTVNSIASVTGSTGNYTVVFNVSSTSAINVGDVLYLATYSLVGSSGPYRLFIGCFQVTAKTASTITFILKYNRSTFPSVTLIQSYLSRITTLGILGELNIQNCNFYSVGSFVSKRLVVGGSTIKTMELINIINGTSSSMISNSTIGDISQLHVTNSMGMAISNCTMPIAGSFTANGSTGLSASSFSKIIVPGGSQPLNVYGNLNDGISLTDSAITSALTIENQVMAVRDNGLMTAPAGYDLRLAGDSYLRFAGASQISVTASPAYNTLGNGKSLIRTF